MAPSNERDTEEGRKSSYRRFPFSSVEDDFLSKLEPFESDATKLGSSLSADLEPRFEEDDSTKSDVQTESTLACSHCRTTFADRDEQVRHFKLDWHRYNLKRTLLRIPPLTQLEFDDEIDRRQDEGGELSSISGSDEEADETDDTKRQQLLEDFVRCGDDIENPVMEDFIEDESPARPPKPNHPKIFFRAADGEIASVYRVALGPKSDADFDAVDRVKLIVAAAKEKRWAVVLTGGGHFAAALFRGNDVIQHKTFHRYVVRQKQGGAQSGRDATGNAPKSAGASLRRYNEAALARDIQELFNDAWSTDLSFCEAVFFRAPSFNRQILFSGKNPVFSKADPRLRPIPFATKRPTFNEVQRVFAVLSSFEIYGRLDSEKVVFGAGGMPKSPRRLTTSKKNSNREQTVDEKPEKVESEAKGDDQQRRPRGQRMQEAPTMPELVAGAEEMEENLGVLVETLEVYDTNNLKEFDCDLGRGSDGKYLHSHPNDPGETRRREEDRIVSSIYSRYKNDLVTFTRTTDAENFDKTVEKIKRSLGDEGIVDENNGPARLLAQVLNSRLKIGPTQKFTRLLHLAVQETGDEHKHFLRHLLESGCDPALFNSDGKPVYLSTGDKGIRLVLRGFRGDFPDKYDYEKAQIPAPLSAEDSERKNQRQAERRKKMRSAKKERDKERREEAKVTEEREREEREKEEAKKKFLQLSDREKRALAAEKRFAAQLNRCWQCGADMTGKTPFEYMDFKFCSTKCLQEHRRKDSGS